MMEQLCGDASSVQSEQSFGSSIVFDDDEETIRFF